ncbi:MAG: T9SS type A sorting domain-containing protein [Bacteroidia bacterium]|nr:T9SS type A sorting domain-containing protein [Bacteroidia bacterium]
MFKMRDGIGKKEIIVIFSSRSNIVGSSLLLSGFGSFDISVYPDQVTSEFKVSFTKELKNACIRITDVVGKPLRLMNVSGTMTRIERSDLNAGIYFIQVISDNEIIKTEKIIIE